MKKLFPLLVLVLLLTGCTREPAPPSTTDTTSPVPSVNPTVSVPAATPSPTPEKSWWEGRTAERLPAEAASVGSIASLDGPVCLALLPQEDIGLYGDPDPTLGILLRKGEHLQFFPQTYATTRYTLPELAWANVDGDNDKELTIKYLVEDLDGNIVYEWHVYEWDGTEWTDRGFTPDIYRPILEELISYAYKDGVVTISAANDSVTAHYDGDKAPQGLAPPGELVFFRYDGDTLKVVFGLRLALSNEKTSDIATLTATLTYDGDGFSMSNYYLEQVGGV